VPKAARTFLPRFRKAIEKYNRKSSEYYIFRASRLEITAERLSFGEEDPVQINSMSIAEIAAMRAEMADLRVKVAHGAATSQMGQGKPVHFEKGGGREDNNGHVRGELVKHGTCLVPACSNQIEAPGCVTKKPTICRECWSDFHDGDAASIALQDKRAVTKNPKGRWQTSVITKALHARNQCAGECLTDHAHDFLSTATIMPKASYYKKYGALS
jgi:hypothetical protein